MTIAIQLDPAFDIENYDGLLAFVTAFLELDAETVTQLPSLLRLAEYRLNRLVVAPERETSASLVTTAGTQSVTLPADYRQLRNARLVSSTGYTLEQVTPDYLHWHYSNSSGEPTVYTISEGGLQLGPVPDAAYTIRLLYKAKIPALSPTNQSNWLLEGNADAYVYALLWQVSAWLEDFDAAEKFRAEMFTIIDEANLQGNRWRRSSPVRLRSPVVV